MKDTDVMTILADGGWRPSVDDDGDIVFRNQGLTHVLHPYPDDSSYLAIVVPNLLEVTSIFERDVALEEVNRINRLFKIGKAGLLGDPGWLYVSTEVLIFSEDGLRQTIDRCCDLLPAMAGDVRRAVRSRIDALGHDVRPGRGVSEN